MKLKYIQSVGIELELIYSLEYSDEFEEIYEDLKQKYGSKLSRSGDGSIEYDDEEERSVEVKFWDEDLKKVLNVAKKFFSICYQNYTCGNHVHLKTNKDNEYLYLFSFDKLVAEFLKRYVKKFKNNEKYLKRLENSWCSAKKASEYYFEQQLKQVSRDYRYAMINFYALYEHNTVEFRILPYVESFKEYKKAVMWLVKTIDNLIDKYIENEGVIKTEKEKFFKNVNKVMKEKFLIERELLKKEDLNFEIKKSELSEFFKDVQYYNC